MGNFDFLKKHDYYDSFSAACIEAEKSMVVSYASVAIHARRGLELAVKWLYSYDEELKIPYRDTLSALIHDYSFKNLIDMRLFPELKFIKDLGNKVIHNSISVKREQAVHSLHCLYNFVSWIDYCYSSELHGVSFDESLLPDEAKERKSKAELLQLAESLGAKDRKLKDIIKENEKLRKEFSALKNENRQNRQYNVETLTEFETRKLYIDLDLERAGWIIGTNCVEEVEVSGMPNKTGKGFVDYVLFGDGRVPLAVVEAKKTSVDPHKGKIQATLYADALERQYGNRPVIFYTNGFDYYIWDNKNFSERKISGIYTKDDLEWLIYSNNNKQELETSIIQEKITDRYYQKMAIQKICETFNSGHRKALIVMATGTGKTRTAISLVDVLQRKGWTKRVLFLADRTNLVRQAKGSFNNLLENSNCCNLVEDKENIVGSSLVFSTYQTMMNSIDETKGNDGNLLFSPGYFDLIIIDESHRSIYKKFQAIFDYFDAPLVGLTATPISDIDRNTYRIFELENNVPTYAYELDLAVKDKFLVPYHTIETRLKIPSDGLHYDQLDEEEKDYFDEVIDEDRKDFDSEDVNSFLFNGPTIDLVLQELMNKGLKIKGGDELGKTIIFAKNTKHANFIIERFDALYPQYSGNFALPIHNKIDYVDSTYDNFCSPEKYPQIAVSVDMLDTGVDIPELLNLVFFKKVRSVAKFWQMIGRGTRLSPNLLGEGLDKKEFRIFDYCDNFDYFRVNKKGKESKQGKSLTEKIFNVKVNIVKELQHLDYSEQEFQDLRNSLCKSLFDLVLKIDDTKFDSKLKREFIQKFRNKKKWDNLSDADKRELTTNVAPFVKSEETDELAKRFDLLMFSLIFAQLGGFETGKFKLKVVETAGKLAEKGSIKYVQQQSEVINRVQTQVFWDNADIFDYEEVRIALRDLIKFIDRNQRGIYYTDFEDTVLSSTQNDCEFVVDKFNTYKEKVNYYIQTHQDEKNDIVIYKLRNNKPLTESDIKHLEQVLWQELGSKADYTNTFDSDQPLVKIVAKIAGLDRNAANSHFSEFLSENSLTGDQMEFVNTIINHVIINGVIEKKDFLHSPLNTISSVFQSDKTKAKKLVEVIDSLNNRLEVTG